MKSFSPFFGTAAVVLMTGAAFGQVTSGNIAGVVKDPTGAVVPNAVVKVKSESTGVVVTSKTNGSGEYLVQNLLPAAYDVSVDAPGFAPTLVKAVPVGLNATATADVTINTGSTSTEVEVSAASVVLDTTSQNLATTFSNEELSSLPTATVGLGVLNTALLVPGVASSGGLGVGTGPSVGGQRPFNNNYTIEGIDNNDKSVTGPLVYVPNDAVGTFSIITNQFSPEFGHSSGGQFNTNVLSGTNRFHGKLYEYFQNRNLNAENAIQGGKIPNPRYDFNRYGGQLGGPILRDKLFFFANYERQTTGESESYYLCTPTSVGMTAIQNSGLVANNVSQFVQNVPVATIAGAGGTGIDASIDNACGITKQGPQQTTITTAAGPVNIPLGNYLVAAPVFSNFDALTTSFDYTISSRDSFRARYIYNTQGSEDTAAALPKFFATIPYRYHLVALSEFHNFTPNLVNEIRVGFNRYYNTTPVTSQSFPGFPVFPNLTFDELGYLNVGPDPNAPQFTIQNLYQITDNISYTHGHHTLKIGFDGRKYISPQGFTQRSRGDYEWSAIDPYLHDLAPDSFGERTLGNNTYYGDQTALYGYGNDTWRATDKLTINAGLRYEFTSVPVGEREQALNSIASDPGLLNIGKPTPTYTALAPRIGVEYAPDDKTSVRAGFGVAYDVLFDNLGILSAPPELSVTEDVGSGAPCYGGQTCPDPLQPNFLTNGGLTGPYTPVVNTYTSAAAARAATSGYTPNQVLPYSETYSLTIQRTLLKSLTAEIGYLGTRGIHLPTQTQINVQPEVNNTNNLPTFVGNSAIEGAGSNASTLAAIAAEAGKYRYYVPAYYDAGFISKVTSYQPTSGSNYNALEFNLQGRARKDLQMNLSYTFSKAMDNATAPTFSTVLTPRRPQNSQTLQGDYSRSGLDHTHRITLEADYTWKIFAGHNWVLRNLVSNWIAAPIYTYESPEYATVLSGTNALINGDSGSAIDRPIINPNGVKGTGTGVTAITNAAGDTIGYQAINPTAYYVQAAPGTIPNVGRNTLPIRPIDNFDLTLAKRFNIYENYALDFSAQAFNVLNHAQYIPGSVDNINSNGYSSSYNFQTVSSAFFNEPGKEFTANARTMQLSAKFEF